MGKCTKSRCPMQVGTVDENCDIKDCPYRTDSDDIMNTFWESIAKYLENTMEITKKVRVPKGEFCDGCIFKKHESPLYSDSNGCPIGDAVWCTLYGERLALSEIFRNNGFMCTTILPANWSYCKCKGCLEDTNAQK